MAFEKIKEAFGVSQKVEGNPEDYLEIDLEKEQRETKISVKLFALKKYEDVNSILAVLHLSVTSIMSVFV